MNTFQQITCVAFACFIAIANGNMRADERDEIAHKIKSLLQEIRESHREGDKTRASELQQEITELMKHQAELNRRFANERGHAEPEEKRREQMAQREELEQRNQELNRVMLELKRAGKHDEANRVLIEIRELEHEMVKHSRRPEGREHPEEFAERRIHHLHQAAENLEAAGFHDEARELHERAEHLGRELKHRHEHDEHAHHPPREFEHNIMDQLHDMRRSIETLHDEVKRLNHELLELKSSKPRIKEKVRQPQAIRKIPSNKKTIKSESPPESEERKKFKDEN